MSMSRMRFLNRSMQSSRSRPSQAAHNTYKLDPTKSHLANALHILRELTVANSCSTDEAWRLSLLSALVKLLVAAQSTDGEQQPSQMQTQQQQQQHIAGILPARDYLYCLSASLVLPVTQIRAATLRALRHSLSSERDVVAFNDLQLPHLLGKSLDVLLDNEEERVQAMKLIRKILSVAPRAISPVVVRSLVALGDSVSDEGDRMLRACLAILCEIGVLNPRVLIMCGGVSAITRNVLECHSPRIAESLVGVLLHLLEQPHTRRMAGVRLDCLAAPYCDFTYRLGIMDKNKDARDLRFTSSRLALLTVLRSWAGTIEFCNPNRASGLKAIVDVLYLNQLEVRKAILDLLYELLWLPQPVWTDEYSVALSVIDPADYQDSWRLAEGFVSAEGRAVLPTLAARVPNICEMHTALLLYCFLETGLLNALVEVVVSGDTFISVRATVLIGKLLQLMHHHLPADILNSVSALPSLVAHATRGNPQARGAIAALQSLHQMMRNRPAACSLFLEAIIQSGGVVNSRAFRRDIDAAGCGVAAAAAATAAAASGEVLVTEESRGGPFTPDQRTATLLAPSGDGGSALKRRTRLDSVGSSLSNSGEEHHHRSAVHSMTNTLRRVGTKRMRALFAHGKQNDRWLRESNVMLSDDEKQWDWDIILTFLKTEAVNKMDDTHCRFIRKLVHFFKPSSNRFSHQDLGHGRYTPTFVTAGLELIDWLLQSQALECIRLLTDLCTDISTHLMAISTARSAHDCLFSPQHMGSTMCQQYFLFIGRMCRTQKGVSILNNTDIFERLSGIVQTTIHVCYIKLIVSGLDYTFAERPREILQQALHCADRRAGQLYATQFMMVLLRARLPGFEVWGLPMLVRQMGEATRVVAMAAHEVLDEATHCRVYLEALVEMWPQWELVGDAGVLTRTRFYSVTRGLNHAAANVRAEIGRWVQGYNKSYVLLCEADTHSVLTLHTKNEEGAYSRRSCSSRPIFVAPHLLPHLYGQLVQTTQGMENLLRFGDLPQLCANLQRLAAIVARPPPANNRADNDAPDDDINDPDQRSLELKAAIWALCHATTSRIGLQHMRTLDGQFIERIVELAKHSGVYSVRATAYHALGLVGSTKAGADYLYTLDWVCVRHDRDTQWPISEPEDWLSKHLHAMRHALDSVAPYNYAGIDDQISVSRYSAGSVPDKASHLQLMQQQQQQSLAQPSPLDIVAIAPAAHAVGAAPNRSKTLPDGNAVRAATSAASHYKHTRSLSESKTSDILTLNAATAAAAGTHRTRFNSGTDSNTSGVSSCESVYGGGGRYTFLNDLHTNTLSPIPSSSNLLDVQQLSTSAVVSATGTSAEGAGRIRRISLTGASFRENTLSVQDAQGYAALRRLRSSQRPVFAEATSTASGGANDDDVVDCAAVERREKGAAELLRLSTLAATRGLKVRSLDRQSAFVMGMDNIRKRTQSCDSATTELNILFANEPSGPCYTGICLPKNILDLFHTGEPTASAGHSYITQISFQDDDSGHEFKPVLQPRTLIVATVPQHHKPGGGGVASALSAHVQLSRSFSVIDAFGEYDPIGAGATTNDTSSMSSLSDISSATSSTGRRSRWMSKHNRQQCFHCCRLTGGGRNDSGFGAATPTTVAVPRRRFSAPLSPPTPLQLSASEAATNSCSDFSDAADRISETILRHVQRMANPVWSKQSKMALLELKQKHGIAYQDVCLYAEVCRALSTNTYRLPARRFLQELFLDLQFEGFARTAAEAFARCEPEVLRRVALEDERRAAAALQSQRREGEGSPGDGSKGEAAGGTERQVQGQPYQQQQHSEHVYATVKTLRHTFLPSVTEASVENLCESLGNKSRHLTVGQKINAEARRNSPHQRHSHPNPAVVQPHPQPSATTSASSPPDQSNRMPAMRPRFNTLELDLTCTRNKFPITDRRKQIQQQLQQTSAPATPSEWSFQHSRTSAAASAAGITTTSTTTVSGNNGGIPSSAAAASGSESSSSTASNGSVLIAAMQATKATAPAAATKPPLVT